MIPQTLWWYAIALIQGMDYGDAWIYSAWTQIYNGWDWILHLKDKLSDQLEDALDPVKLTTVIVL